MVWRHAKGHGMSAGVAAGHSKVNLDSWLDLLACPTCRGRLEPNEEDSQLNCPRCQVGLPFTDGVLRALDLRLDHAEDRIKQREVVARDQAADDYDQGEMSARNSMEIPPCLQAMQPGPTDVVTELGCGTGRLTLRYLSQVRRVVALDFSLASLRLVQRRVPPGLRDRLLLIHADITAPPLARAAFTKAVSFQVLEHLPTAESRQQAVTIAADLLRPGGAFTFSVYHWSLGKQRDANLGVGDYTAKEGYHDSGIYYYNFEEPEIRRMLNEARLTPELLEGLIIPVRGGKLLGPLVVSLNRWLCGKPYGIRRAHLLLARGRAPETPRH